MVKSVYYGWEEARAAFNALFALSGRFLTAPSRVRLYTTTGKIRKPQCNSCCFPYGRVRMWRKANRLCK